MIEVIKSYLYTWYLENKLTLLILGGLIVFIYYLNHQYKINYRSKIRPKTPLENLEEELLLQNVSLCAMWLREYAKGPVK